MNKTVILSQKYTIGDSSFDTVVIREPTYREIFMDDLGKPQELQPGPGGKAMLITYPAAIDAYLKRLVVEPNYEDLAVLSAVDSLALGSVIIDFFLDGTAQTKRVTG